MLSTLFASHKDISPVLENIAFDLEFSLALLEANSLHYGTPFNNFLVYLSSSLFFS
jgi:hypothetical protein